LDRISRRKLIASVGLGLAAPLIASVLVPTPAAAESATVVAFNDTYQTDEDTLLVTSAGTGVLANDVFSPPGTASLVDPPSHGNIILNTDGSFSYNPDADFVGTDSFSYQLTTSAGSAQATVTINVFPVV
ncbi:MAG: cadherin-like domain-containing protein, partial [Candidatus Eremiobacteraeota bacterium]|nr:cadherin-like domain-containing protein [Candidatus Eremiobacteraeota bacterium]